MSTRKASWRGRPGTLSDDNLCAQAFRGWPASANQLEHAFHGGSAQSKFGLADGGQRYAEMFTDENVSKASKREVIRDSKALTEEDGGRANGDEVVDGLNGGRAR